MGREKTLTKYIRGTSFIEVVIYAALFGIISFFAIDFVIDAYGVMGKISLQRVLNTEGEAVMQRMLREVRDAYDIDLSQSTFDANPGALRLQAYAQSSGSATTTADFRITNGLIHFSKATTSIDMISSRISVDTLVFRRISTPVSSAVKIELGLIASSSSFSVSSTLYGTAILRGSY